MARSRSAKPEPDRSSAGWRGRREEKRKARLTNRPAKRKRSLRPAKLHRTRWSVHHRPGERDGTGLRRFWRLRGATSRWLVILGLVGAATVGAMLVWRDRQPWPALRAGERRGIDVSHYQGEIDWAAVADDGIEFAYIKSTEGGDTVDERFAENWSGARRTGIKVGAYHFFTLCRTGADQAANFLRTVPSGQSDLAPSVDLEFEKNCAARPAVAVLRRELSVFLDRIEQATGRQVLLYVSPPVEAKYAITTTFARPIWERRLFERPEDVDWDVWQWSNVGRVDGIGGDVDLNVGRASR